MDGEKKMEREVRNGERERERVRGERLRERTTKIDRLSCKEKSTYTSEEEQIIVAFLLFRPETKKNYGANTLD